jgi:hypothetical protein
MLVKELQPEGSHNQFLLNLSLNWACSQQKAYLMVAAEPSHVLNRGPIKDISMWCQLYLWPCDSCDVSFETAA